MKAISKGVFGTNREHEIIKKLVDYIIKNDYACVYEGDDFGVEQALLEDVGMTKDELRKYTTFYKNGNEEETKEDYEIDKGINEKPSSKYRNERER